MFSKIRKMRLDQYTRYAMVIIAIAIALVVVIVVWYGTQIAMLEKDLSQP
jgi:hypothetical protein